MAAGMEGADKATEVQPPCRLNDLYDRRLKLTIFAARDSQIRGAQRGNLGPN
jgi:hypothetical protein